jgi:hypothetical protein
MDYATAEQHANEEHGLTMLVTGVYGVGKTSLVKTLSKEMLAETTFIRIENGTLAIAGLPVARLTLETWEEVRDFAAIVGGPNPALPSNAIYSQAHYNSAIANPVYSRLATSKVFFFDSLSAIARFSFDWSKEQPESFSHGKPDLRGAYGLHARNMVSLLSQLQRAKSKIIILTCALGQVTDDFNVTTWQLLTEGARTNRELPGILDEVITMQWIDFGDGQLTRAFICVAPNRWGFPAKDRSGKLGEVEEPNLNTLLNKLLTRGG